MDVDITLNPYIAILEKNHIFICSTEFNNLIVSIGHNLAKDVTCNVSPLCYVNSVNDSIVV